MKETEGKKRKSPLTPLREKGKGKKLDPILRDQVYRARAYAYARETAVAE